MIENILAERWKAEVCSFSSEILPLAIMNAFVYSIVNAIPQRPEKLFGSTSTLHSHNMAVATETTCP